jgi:hypothetical protein
MTGTLSEHSPGRNGGGLFVLCFFVLEVRVVFVFLVYSRRSSLADGSLALSFHLRKSKSGRAGISRPLFSFVERHS